MWSIDAELIDDFFINTSKYLPLTTTNILYIDQSLGGWLYEQLTYIKNDKHFKSAFKDKIKNFTIGAGETAVSTAVPIMLVEAGIITSELATPAGVLICVLFLFMHAVESPSELDVQIKTLHKYMIPTDGILNTPVALIFKTETAIYKETRQLWDAPGSGPEPQILVAHKFQIEPWDGTVFAAGGAELLTGRFTFDHYSELEKTEFFNKLKTEVRDSR